MAGATRSGLFSALETDCAETPTCRATSPRVTCPCGDGTALAVGPVFSVKISHRDGGYPDRSVRDNPPAAAAAARPGLVRGGAGAAAGGRGRAGPARRRERLVRRRRAPPRHPRARRRGVGPRPGPLGDRRCRPPGVLLRRPQPRRPAARPDRPDRPEPRARAPTASPRPSWSSRSRRTRSTSCCTCPRAPTSCRWAAVKQGGAGARRPAQADRGRPPLGRTSDVELAADPAPEVDAAAGRLTLAVPAGPGRAARRHLGPGHRRRTGEFGPRPPGALVGRGRVRRHPAAAYRRAEPGRPRAGCCCATATTGSWRPAARGSSPSSAATRCGRPGCWCRSTPGSRCRPCGCWRAGRGPGTTRRPRSSPARSCTRCASEQAAGAHSLPPLYYGTVDATPLFVCTLADAHAWGADPDQVRELLPAVRGCLGWLMAQSAESGWLRYVDQTGTGLSNQGWKDSHDSVQFADGSAGRAADRAVRGAGLCVRRGGPGRGAARGVRRGAGARAARVGRRPAGPLRRRVLGGRRGRRPRRDRPRRRRPPVDSVTSNMGHLLGTGLLDRPATARVADPAGRPAPRLRVRPAHPRLRLAPLLAALLPRRHRLAARHRHRRPRARGRRPPRRGRPAGPRPVRRGRGRRLPPARAVRRRRGRRRTPSRRPTPPPAARRPGRPPRRWPPWSRSPAWSSTPPAGRSPTRPAPARPSARSRCAA